MRYEYIEPLTQATKKVLEQVTGGEVASGDIALVKSEDLAGDVSILISVKGESEGCIIVCFDSATARGLCELMNKGACAVMDDGTCKDPSLETDTIAELSNMIAGNATSALNDLGFDFSVYPPSLISRTEIEQKIAGIEIFRVLLGTSCGELSLNVALKTN